MSFPRPKVLYVGAPQVGDALQSMKPEWEFVKDISDEGIARPITSIKQLQEGLQNETIDNEVEVVMLLDMLFDANDPNALFESAIATMAPYSLTMVVSYQPALQTLIKQRVLSAQTSMGQSGDFYFIDSSKPMPSIDFAIERFVKESGQREVSEIVLGRSLEPQIEEGITIQEPGAVSIFDQSDSGKGKVIAITSNKGGSGKTTVAVSLASYLAHSSKASYRDGLESQPLKICVVDFDVRDGQVGFVTGPIKPTMFDLFTEGLSDKALDETIIPHERLGLDILLAPKMVRYAEDLSMPFFEDLLRLLRRRYDYIIVDTSVNYLDPLLEKVTYPQADFIIFVCDYIIQSLFGMTRWITETTKEKSSVSGVTGGSGVDKNKIGIVINKALNKTSLDKNMLLQATQGLPILTAIPANPRAVGHATNNQSLDMLVRHENIKPSLGRLAKEIVGNSYQLSEDF